MRYKKVIERLEPGDVISFRCKAVLGGSVRRMQVTETGKYSIKGILSHEITIENVYIPVGKRVIFFRAGIHSIRRLKTQA